MVATSRSVLPWTSCGAIVIVVDASVLAPALADDSASGDRARARLAGQRLVAPGLIDLEVVSVIRGALRAGRLDLRRAGLALGDLADLQIERAQERRLLPRIWELKDNLTPYDACYVALAEALGAPLVTADERIAREPGVRCEVELLGVAA